MDFEVQGLEGVVGSESGLTLLASDSETKQKLYGSGFLKQERSGNDEDDWRCSKLAKFDHVFPQQSNTSFRSDNNTSVFFDGQQQQQQQILSFSAPKSEALSSSQNVIFPYLHLASPAYTRNTGYNVVGGFDGANMNGGAFSPSQWMELEHQALIYKYLTANMPIPSNLLIPIRKALDSSSAGGFLRPNSLGWGPFHIGFSNNTDPEQGRCRRTDGKKWRCSRDAVPDQKYCERHMNRGHRRSRKHVEGQSGRSVATTTATTSKLMHSASSCSAAVVGPSSGSGKSNSLAIAQQQFKNSQPAGQSNLSESAQLNRMLLNKEIVGETIHDTAAPVNEFGVVSSESLLNPSHESSSLVKCISFGCSQDLNSQETESDRCVRQFIDGWPNTQPERSSFSWPEVDVQSDRTQLSIALPMMVSDFMSSTSSPNNESVTHLPLQLSHELDPIQMGLGVGRVGGETNQRQANWIPISWQTNMGGPLGEALHSTSCSTADDKNSSALILKTESWDHSPRFGSSPTGVLQKTAFGSLSNSSAGSSPRAESNKNNQLGSTVVHSSSLPAL